MNKLLCSVALGLTVLATPHAAMAETPKDMLIIAREISSIAEWDPAVSQVLDTQMINLDIYQRLVGYNAQDADDLQPIVAESWDIGPDGKTITFTIRDGLTFHSGNPITSADVLYSMRRLLLLGREPSSSMSQLGYTPENIDDLLKAPDPRTFVMTLGATLAPSLVINMMSSASFSVVDSTLLKAHEENGDFGSKWLSDRSGGQQSAGSGPFMIATFRPGELVMLDRFDGYNLFKPAMKRVIFRHVPEAGTQRLMLEQGDIDVAFNLTATDAAELNEDPDDGVTIEYHPSRTVNYLAFNTTMAPFDNPEVIRAMRYLVDYEGLSKTIMKDIGTIHQTFIPKGWLGSLTETPFHLDVEKAKEILAGAGYPDGFEFDFTGYNFKPGSDIATSFQATAALAGVKVNVLPTPLSQSIPMYRDQKLQALMLSYSGGYADPHSTASKFTLNSGALPGADRTAKYPSEMSYRVGWYPEDLSIKTIEAARELDTAKRVEMYEELQRANWERGPFVHLFQYTQALGQRDTVHGYLLGARGADVSFAAVTKD